MSQHYDRAGARLAYDSERAARRAAPIGYDAQVYRCGKCHRWHYSIDDDTQPDPGVDATWLATYGPQLGLFGSN